MFWVACSKVFVWFLRLDKMLVSFVSIFMTVQSPVAYLYSTNNVWSYFTRVNPIICIAVSYWFSSSFNLSFVCEWKQNKMLLVSASFLCLCSRYAVGFGCALRLQPGNYFGPDSALLDFESCVSLLWEEKNSQRLSSWQSLSADTHPSCTPRDTWEWGTSGSRSRCAPESRRGWWRTASGKWRLALL